MISSTRNIYKKAVEVLYHLSSLLFFKMKKDFKKGTVAKHSNQVPKAIEDFLKIKYNEENQQVTSARALWEWLEVETPFTKWFARRVEEYGFEEGSDYAEVLDKNVRNLKGGRPSTDYAIKLGMGKELSMAERTEKGKATRKYFLACEESAKDKSMPALPQTYAEALRMLADKVDENKALSSKLYITEEELSAYKLRFEGILTRGEWAKKLNEEYGYNIAQKRSKNSKRPSISEILADMGITQRDGENEIAKQEYVSKGWFVNVKKRGSNGFPSVVTYITPIGQKELGVKVKVYILKAINNKLGQIYNMSPDDTRLDVMAHQALLDLALN